MADYIVYKYTSKTTGKSYIGQTNQPSARMKKHQKADSGYAFSNAILKYGFDDFIFNVLAEGLLLSQANTLESQYIDKFNCLSPNGYNLRMGGDNAVFSDESRKKLSITQTGRKLSESTKAKISEIQIGKKRKPHSPEVIERIRLGNIGKKRSQETTERIKASQQNRSEETRVKMGAVHKGVVYSEERKALQSKNLTGRPVSSDTRLKSSESAKNRGISPLTRIKSRLTKETNYALRIGRNLSLISSRQ
jgi:group I intron endonuclease